MKDDRNDVRIACLKALGYLGKTGTAAEPDLLELLRDDVAEVRSTAFDSLKTLSTPGRVVPKLVLIVKDDHPDRREEAVVWLGELGPQAKSAVPILLTLLDESGAQDSQLKIAV